MEKLAIIVGLLIDIAVFGGLTYAISKIGPTAVQVIREKSNSVNGLLKLELIGIAGVVSLYMYQRNTLALWVLLIVFLLSMSDVIVFTQKIKKGHLAENSSKYSKWQKLIVGLSILIFFISYPTKIHYESEVAPIYVEQRPIAQLLEELDGYYYINDSGEETYQTITEETEIIYSKGIPYSYATCVVIGSYRQMWNDNSIFSIDYKTTNETYHHTLWIKE